jgi:hypothetical protein
MPRIGRARKKKTILITDQAADAEHCAKKRRVFHTRCLDRRRIII